MVEWMNSFGNLTPQLDPASNCLGEFPLKLEIIEDFLEEEYGTVDKRPRVYPCLHQQLLRTANNAFMVQPPQCNPLDERSPLGLNLRKSPSLVDLVQTRLAATVEDIPVSSGGKKLKASSSSSGERVKASNFSASKLQIGQWEYNSQYDGDLVAKFYYAKQRLVWEVMRNGVKRKIEIQWSYITALSANCPEDKPGTLTVVLARPPRIYRETCPQPRKHTLWQSTPDFTGGQASVYRQHVLQFPRGVLEKHYKKLIQCDDRLFLLSHQPEIVLSYPYFEAQHCIIDDSDESNDQSISGYLDLDKAPSISGFQNLASQPSLQHMPQDVSSHGSAIDWRNTRGWDQINENETLRSSMSVSDFMNQLKQCISDPASESTSEILDYLLNDTHHINSLSDENSIMKKVNSLCCLLQNDTNEAANPQLNNDTQSYVDCPNLGHQTDPTICGPEASDGFSSSVSGIESIREPPLLHLPPMAPSPLPHLPPMAASPLPQFLPTFHNL